MSLLEKASLIVTPNAYKEDVLYSVVPNDRSGDLDVVRATTKTRVNADGLIESVGINVPSIDYSGGGCPSILVEPQGTNLVRYSQEFDNEIWTKRYITITTNSTTAPDGSLTADKISGDGTTSIKDIIQSGTSTLTAGTIYTTSFYAKKNTHNFIQIVGTTSAYDTNTFANFDLNNGVVGSFGGGVISSNIISVGNGWYRCSMTATCVITSSTSICIVSLINSATSPKGESNSLSTSLYLWGAQLEAGSNATSYIPTVASTVTRNYDVISKTGISDLIGQTEGTMYAYLSFKEGGEKYNGIELFGNSTNRLFIRKDVNDRVIFGGIINGTSNFSNLYNSNYDFFKIAIIYNSTQLKIYINGSLFQTRTFTTNFSATLSTLNFNLGNNTLYNFQGKVKNLQLYKTALTDEELAQLTTI